MGSKDITNSTNAYRTVSDYRTMKDDSGEELSYGEKEVELFQANGAIAKGLGVAIVSATSATVPARVTKGTASTYFRNRGIVAKASAAAGDLIPVVTEGLAFATAGGAISANDHLGFDANGKVVALSMSATIVTGAVVAIALAAAAAEDDTVPVYVVCS